jgi:hypothetical protein
MSRTPLPKLSPAERAHLIVLAQEARRERLERRVERELSEQAELRQLMEGESILKPHAMHNQGDQWECEELARINRNRPASRICFTLPARCYDARNCNRYADR